MFCISAQITKKVSVVITVINEMKRREAIEYLNIV